MITFKTKQDIPTSHKSLFGRKPPEKGCKNEGT